MQWLVTIGKLSSIWLMHVHQKEIRMQHDNNMDKKIKHKNSMDTKEYICFTDAINRMYS